MAHHLNFNKQTGKYSFFSVQQKAWHGLGQIVEDYPTSAEAIRFAGLDYEVEKQPNIHELPTGKKIVSETSFFTFRTDTEEVLGDRIGKDYHIVQNRDAFAFFDSIVGNGEGILYETAGALGKGEQIFITAKLPDYIRVGKDDLVEQYLFLSTSHDGSGSITAAFTPVRIVCANTLNAAMRNKSQTVRIRHTSGARERLEQAHRLMGISHKLAAELETVFNHWTGVKITDREVKRLIQLALAPNRETLDKLHSGREEELSTVFTNACEDAFAYAMISDTQQMDTAKGTLFGAYNAVTGYFQNVRQFKDDEAKVKSILCGGTAQQRGQKAFSLCEEIAAHGTEILS